MFGGDISYGLLPFALLDDSDRPDATDYWNAVCPKVTDWDRVDADVKSKKECAHVA